MIQHATLLLVLLLVMGNVNETQAQLGVPPDEVLAQIEYRSIGPFRGGRAAAVEGVTGKPNLFYMGATGGGVWRTEDGGSHWINISDKYFGGSIGAISVAPSNANVIYVGGGEVTVRGNVSHGDGVWKSNDAGKTWKHVGLGDTRHIPRIRIHPRDEQTVYVAALGHLFGPNRERGVFRSRDGGETWQNILFVNDEVGAVDLVFDPNDPSILYASTWRVLRTPYSLESGGEGSGLWKSIDGGDTWQEITRNAGLPGGTIGISGVAVSPVDSNRVWAIIEAEEGGLFRSDNAGETWRRINDDRNLRQRAWYYTRVYAGPQDRNEVYVLNVGFWRSEDGGVKFDSIDTPHSDHHDLWIAPEDPQRMAIADDGGVQVSFNRGETFSTYENQPTAQFYRVTTDNHFPYRIYGAQQDNSTIRIAHRSSGRNLTERDWESTAGGESGFLAPDPLNPEIVYGGSYGGYLERMNHATGESRTITVWPDNPIGYGAGDIRYRFQWNFPIFFSPTNPKKLYAAANVLFVTENEGQSWKQISPDLTRNDPRKLGSSGGPITQDNTSVEYYCTIFAAMESQHDANTIWVGSDDGLLHVTRDGGEKWDNVTPPEMPEWSMINSIEIHPTEPGGLYVAATRYKLDDFKPYLFKTLDYGKTWTRIDNGIDRKHFTRVVRADSQRPGLLYAGTEYGMYISFNDGQSWQAFQNNLPQVPITDLTLKNGDLIVATQGRSFWMIDDLSLLRTWDANVTSNSVTLFPIRSIPRIGGGSGSASLTAGANVRYEAPIRFYVSSVPAENVLCTLTVTDPLGGNAKTFSTQPKSNEERLSLKAGLNLVSWDLRYQGAETFEGLILWGGGTQGPKAPPGKYLVELTCGESTYQTEFELTRDPRSSASDQDLVAQFEFLIGVREKLTETHVAIKRIRSTRTQLEAFLKRFKDDEAAKALKDLAEEIIRETTAIEEALYQTKNRSGQDPLNYPIRLNNRLSALVGVVGQGDNRPTDQAVAFRAEVTALIDVELAKLKAIFENQVASFNEQFNQLTMPYIEIGK